MINASRWTVRATSLLAAAATCAALAGCGLGAGDEVGGVHLRVTDDFGAKVLTEPKTPTQAGADTVMRLLQRNAKVETRYGGGFVQSIDGLAGKAAAGQQVDWFFYVNGVLAGRGAASWRVAKGERIWWDRHRWDLAQISAVVGDYPQPMKDGHDGKWAGAQLDCRAATSICDTAREHLEDAGVKVTSGPASAAGGRTRVIVGTWPRIKDAAKEVAQLAGGPAVSGVFAKVGDDGTVAPLDEAGRPVASAAVGTRDDALVAALQTGDASPVWVVTGRDERAAASAARALDPDALAGRAAVIVRDDSALALPLRSGDVGRKVSQ